VNRRRRSLVAVLSATLALVVALVGAASGQTEPDRQRQIGEQIEGYRSQVQEASAEEARLLGELDASVARKRELDAKVAAMDADISVVQRNLNAAQSRLAAAEAEQRGAELRLADAQHQLAEARARLAAYAVACFSSPLSSDWRTPASPTPPATSRRPSGPAPWGSWSPSGAT
jgi:septal ring factor EnvC (AmiA/AmiB activator)